jgi:hypothetical protein
MTSGGIIIGRRPMSARIIPIETRLWGISSLIEVNAGVTANGIVENS